MKPSDLRSLNNAVKYDLEVRNDSEQRIMSTML